MATQHDVFIDGKWQQGRGPELQVLNPATEEVIATVVEGSADQCRRAIASARRAFDEGPWPGLSPKERSRVLQRFHECMEKRRDDLMKLAFTEIGCTHAIAPRSRPPSSRWATGPSARRRSNPSRPSRP